MSSFEDSPVKRHKDSPDYERQAIDHEIEDRLLVPELGKQAAAEENERLLEEIAGSSILPEGSQSPVDAARMQTDLHEQYIDAGVGVSEARRPSRDMKAIVLKDDISTLEEFHESKKPNLLSYSLPSPRHPFIHAIDLALAPSKPWHASSFLPSLLSHYLSHLSFIQLPTYLALYLYPIYPSLFPTLASQNYLSSPEVQASHPSPFATSRLSATVLSYHAQLSSLGHYIPATRLRKNCASVFPAVTTRADPGQVPGFWCRHCQKMSKGPLGVKGRCTRCRKDWGGCMVCGELRLTKAKAKDVKKNAASQASGDSEERFGQVNKREKTSRSKGARWTYCSICGHSGHASCSAAWFNAPESRGACAVAGCGHACAPGAARDELRAAIARERAELGQLRKGRGVLSDERVVRESKAVQAVKGDASDDKGLLITHGKEVVGTGNGLVGIPMESVREEGMLERNITGLAMGRGRGRWRSGQGSGLAAGTASGVGNPALGGAGAGRRVGRNSIGSSAAAGGVGFGIGVNAESRRSLEEGLGGINAGRERAEGGGGGVLGAGKGGGVHRRVTILEPGQKGGEEDMMGEFLVEEGVVSSSVP